MMTDPLTQWAARYGLPPSALAELRGILSSVPELDAVTACAVAGKNEAFVQSTVRLNAMKQGRKLFRNNVGVLEAKDGRPVRYGLANDSASLNKVIKSSDLIGYQTILITPQMVGSLIARFESWECKRDGWVYTGTEREKAQLRWNEMVIADGGSAGFTTGGLPE